VQATQRFGVGSGGSPLVSGHSAANDALEHDLATYVQPGALYFYAGYATNTGIIPALVGDGDTLFSDALNHACLIDGARRAPPSTATHTPTWLRWKPKWPPALHGASW
jgi:8-amino-7-oxononanoate synthase